MSSKAPIILLLGAGALLLARKKESGSTAQTNGRFKDDVDQEPKELEEEELEDEEDDVEDQMKEVVDEWEHPEGMATLGRLYQVRLGDNLLDVAAEALFGSRETREDPAERQAVIDLSIRIDCAPWNQALYGKPAESLKAGHFAIQNEWTDLGISFNPVYSDNRARMLDGEKPTAKPGKGFAFLWIPMIDMYLFDEQKVVSVHGMAHENGGHSLIDPPIEVLELGFDKIAAFEVGCNFPEGDFRRTLEGSA
jgi:hypothetical protein